MMRGVVAAVARVACALLVMPAWAAATALDGLDFRHGIAFFDELKYPPDFTHLDYLNPDAPKGGVLHEATQSAFNNLAPLVEGGIGAPSGFWFSSDTLLIRAGDEVSAFYGRLADGIAITDDRLAMVFRIHPDARWRDGVPITSADVAFTFDTLRAQLGGGMYLGFIDSVEPIDARHVAIHLKTPLTVNHVIMVQFTSILPAHYWRERDPTVASLEPPLSSGPYRVASLKAGRYIEYERDPNYWGRDIPVNRGRYNFDRVRYEVYRDATVIRESFRKGLIDIWTETDVRYWHSAYDTPAFERGWIKKIRRQFGIEVGVRSSIALNNRQPRFQDRRVREALTLAMNFAWQNRALHHGYHKRAQSYWPDTILAATGLPSEGELELLTPHRDRLPPELFERAFRFPAAQSAAEHRDHLVRARDLFRAAGWQVVDDTLANAAGEPFELRFVSQNPADARILLPYFDDLKRLGIKPELRVVESSQFINLLRNFDFDAMLKNQDILMPPVIELKSTYHSEAANLPLSRNVAGIADPVLDLLVTEAGLVTTLEGMVATCRAIDRVLLWGYYQIPLYAVDRRRTVHWDRFGIPEFEPKYWPAFPDGWWYDPAKAARIVTDAAD